MLQASHRQKDRALAKNDYRIALLRNIDETTNIPGITWRQLAIYFLYLGKLDSTLALPVDLSTIRRVRQPLLVDLSLFFCILHPLFFECLCGVVGGAAPWRLLLRFCLLCFWVQVQLLQGCLGSVHVPLLRTRVCFCFVECVHLTS